MTNYKAKYVLPVVFAVPLIQIIIRCLDLKDYIGVMHPSDYAVIVNVFSFPDAVSMTLIYGPVLMLAADYIQQYARICDLVRLKSRDDFILINLKQNLRLVCVFSLVVESIVLLEGFFLVPVTECFNGSIICCFVLEVVGMSLFFYRAICIYSCFRIKTDRRLLSLICSVILYISECVIYSYVLYKSPVCPCYTLELSDFLLTGSIGALQAGLLLSIGLLLDIVLSLSLIVMMRKKDMLSYEK